jgi:oxygen-independent coproporphyrinogen-3 oxidase
MYGLPGQTVESWRATLRKALVLDPAHLSCYALTIEEGTRLEENIRRSAIPAPDAGLQNEMEELAASELAVAGFHRYEISNYHRGASQCRHNLLYWTGGAYLGLGPSAQSYVGDARFGNVPDLAEYTGLLEAGTLPRADIEYLSPRQRAREAVVFGLRKIDGIPAGLLHEGRSSDWIAVVHRLIDEKYLERSDDSLRLTARGRRYADEVSMQLL